MPDLQLYSSDTSMLLKPHKFTQVIISPTRGPWDRPATSSSGSYMRRVQTTTDLAGSLPCFNPVERSYALECSNGYKNTI